MQINMHAYMHKGQTQKSQHLSITIIMSCRISIDSGGHSDNVVGVVVYSYVDVDGVSVWYGMISSY